VYAYIIIGQQSPSVLLLCANKEVGRSTLMVLLDTLTE